MDYTEIPERRAIIDKIIAGIFCEFTAFPQMNNILSDAEFRAELPELHTKIRAWLYALMIADEGLILDSRLKRILQESAETKRKSKNETRDTKN